MSVHMGGKIPDPGQASNTGAPVKLPRAESVKRGSYELVIQENPLSSRYGRLTSIPKPKPPPPSPPTSEQMLMRRITRTPANLPSLTEQEVINEFSQKTKAEKASPLPLPFYRLMRKVVNSAAVQTLMAKGNELKKTATEKFTEIKTTASNVRESIRKETRAETVGVKAAHEDDAKLARHQLISAVAQRFGIEVKQSDLDRFAADLHTWRLDQGVPLEAKDDFKSMQHFMRNESEGSERIFSHDNELWIATKQGWGQEGKVAFANLSQASPEELNEHMSRIASRIHPKG